MLINLFILILNFLLVILILKISLNIYLTNLLKDVFQIFKKVRIRKYNEF